jgi:hypothetical protein
MRFSLLAGVELQLIMQFGDKHDRVALACTHRFARDTARDKFAWHKCPLVKATLHTPRTPGSLLNWVPDVMLHVTEHVGDVTTVPPQCRALFVSSAAQGVHDARAVLSQRGIANVESATIEKETSPSMSPIDNVDVHLYAKSADERMQAWVELLPRACPLLKDLSLKFNGAISVHPQTHGAFASLERLELMSSESFTTNMSMAASFPKLHALRTCGMPLQRVVDMLVGVPYLRELYINDTEFAYHSQVLIGPHLDHVTLLAMEYGFLVHVLGMISRDTTCMPQLTYIWLHAGAVSPFDNFDPNNPNHHRMLPQFVDTLFSARPALRGSVQLDEPADGDHYLWSAQETMRNALHALQDKFDGRLSVPK